MAQPAQLDRGQRHSVNSTWRPWMQRALQLAALGAGRTSPNPLVGCVVLDANGQLVGEGFHARAGTPHAEVHALRQAGERARGGTAVVTLEPCCHHGRTPPCCDALLAVGIARVVVAMADPDPRVAGQGMARLRAAGVGVISGIDEAEAQALNRAFIHRVQHGRPLGILKWAMSADGRTALPNGSSQWISGQPARAWVHRLRAACDAVIVGGGTVRADDPLLTSRGIRTPEPLRVCSAASWICRRRAVCGSAMTPPPWWPMARRPRPKPGPAWMPWGWNGWNCPAANRNCCWRPWPTAAAIRCCGNAARGWHPLPWGRAACNASPRCWPRSCWAERAPAPPWGIWG